MGSDFVFELGVFEAGFIPTEENRSEWAAYWAPAQRVGYHSVNRWFTSVYDVVNNSGDFTVNTPAWVWGFNGDPDSGEWLLFRHDSWKWPKANPTNPLDFTWRASDANQVLIGSVGKGALLRSQKNQNALPPTTTWAQWRKLNLGDKASQPGSDLNENGIPDVFEFVSGQIKAGGLKLVRTPNGFELRIPRRLDRPATIYLEVSYDLVEWFPAQDFVREVDSNNTEVVYQDQLSDENTPNLFWRYSVEPQ